MPASTADEADNDQRSAQLARVYAMTFASIYPLYVAKVEEKGRTSDELDQVIGWLTGYSPPSSKARSTTRSTSSPSLPRHPS